jgi:transposase
MSFFIMGEDRQQTWMLPQSVEDYVSEDNPVRFIDAFVEGLDMRQAGLPEQCAATGRPGYAPADLLKLYLYGYLNRVRSSRELERLTHRNIEVIWLLRRLRPDHKTISEFRRAHRRAFKQVFRQFNLLCRELRLFGAEIVAIDGSIFKAVNSKARNYTCAKLQGLLKAVDGGIENYLKELELNDSSETNSAATSGTKNTRSEGLSEKIKALKEAKQRYEQMLAQIQQDKGSQISLTDPDARLMKKSTSKDCIVGYNVQSAVDARHHLIVEIEATTQPNDLGQFNAIAQRAREQLGTGELTVVADGGYYATNDLKAAEAQGISAHVPSPVDKMDKAGLHGRERFRYDQERDEYECPAGERLVRHGDSQQHGKVYEVYYNSAACARCALRAQCTTGRYRKLKHVENHEIMERIKERMKREPQVYAQRKALVEHPFGTLKFWWGQGAFLTRGKAAVNAEIALSALAYNLKRALKVLGVRALMAWAGTRALRAAC